MQPHSQAASTCVISSVLKFLIESIKLIPECFNLFTPAMSGKKVIDLQILAKPFDFLIQYVVEFSKILPG